jgi:antitoxin ParD1/3/4
MATISLPDPTTEWIEERIRSGQFANASDYIGNLTRDDRERRERLVSALIEGEQSGLSHRTVRDIIAGAKSTVGDGQFELTGAADRDLTDIYIYSHGEFGERQADDYLLGLENLLRASRRDGRHRA